MALVEVVRMISGCLGYFLSCHTIVIVMHAGNNIISVLWKLWFGASGYWNISCYIVQAQGSQENLMTNVFSSLVNYTIICILCVLTIFTVPAYLSWEAWVAWVAWEVELSLWPLNRQEVGPSAVSEDLDPTWLKNGPWVLLPVENWIPLWYSKSKHREGGQKYRLAHLQHHSSSESATYRLFFATLIFNLQPQ